MSHLTANLLILLCFFSLIATIFSQDRIKQILCLACAYLSFFLFIVVISVKLAKQNAVLNDISLIVIFFTMSLLVGLTIAKKSSITTQ